MKAILINAENQTVSYVNNAGDLSAMYAAINCDMVEIGHYDDNTGDTVWVDEEGLLKSPTVGFQIYGKEFVGSGIIYGSSYDGENKDVTTTLEDVQPVFFRLVGQPVF